MKTEHLDRLRENWAALGLKRQLIVGGIFVASVLGILLITKVATRTDYALLYSGLEPAAAGEIVSALEQRGVAHQVRPSGLYVDASERDRLRISLAAEGLPAVSGGGYELLDSLSGFGTTSQMFDATYKRAKEGELARTIASSSALKAARVHISPPERHGFRDRTPGSASVFVTPVRGALSAPQVEALQYLVASAVAGLSPEMVSVIDSLSGRLLSMNKDTPGFENDLALSDTLRARVERLLEARVGNGNAIVEVNVAFGLDRERVVERRFDPESRVAISTETTENNTTSNQAGRGPVTVASNLPDGDAAASGEDSHTENETRERVNYEVSETTREIDRGPGTIEKLSVAVLVNGLESLDQNGAVQIEPRTETEIASLTELVKSAVGFDETRGDTITIRSMEMPEASLEGEVAERTLLSELGLNVSSLLQAAIIGSVAVLLGLFVFKPILLASVKRPELPPPSERGLPAPSNSSKSAGSPSPKNTPGPKNSQEPDVLEGEVAGPGVPLPERADVARVPNKADAVSRLREQMALRKSDSLAVLQNWVEDAGEVRQ